MEFITVVCIIVAFLIGITAGMSIVYRAGLSEVSGTLIINNEHGQFLEYNSEKDLEEVSKKRFVVLKVNSQK